MSFHLPAFLQPESLTSPIATRACQTQIEDQVIELFDENRDRVLAFVLAFRLSAHDAEEVVQEVFLSLFRHLVADRPRDNLRGWIFRVAHNLALKKRYSNQRRLKWFGPEESSTRPQVDPSWTPEERVVVAQQRDRMISAFNALSETDQLCFTLRAEGLKYREISRAVGISLGSVAQSLARSIDRLGRAGEF